ncbi:Cytochrome P450 [Macleaya cordata]|uniref:Cytochrome P450 n=1 Tax=Macleaya cordata TaxID=56857 RepID=A0A200Q529_MACCD|nr:Cytochrome P450 [Macleaya cordata]
MELPFEYLLCCFLGLAASLMYILSSRFIRADGRSPPLPPGSYGWPVIGETVEARNLYRSGRPQEFVQTRMSKHNKDVFKTSLLGQKTIVFCGAAGHKLLFTSEKQWVITCWPQILSKLFGDSFLTAPYDEAIRTRKIVTGFLKKDLLPELVQRFDKVCKKRIKEDWVGNDDQNWQSKLLEEFNILLDGVFRLPIYFPGTKHYKAVKSSELIRRELIKLIEVKRSTKRNSSERVEEQDLISYLIDATDEDGTSLTDKEIANNVITLIDGGHDTSSSTMMLVIKYLAENPECYRRVHEEQTEIAMLKGPGELLNKDDLQKMKYSWTVVSEVLRLWPPVQGTFRKAMVDFTYAGFSIPKGWQIWWNPHSTHMNEEYFPNPHKFDPSRFERGTPAPYAYVPFGGGPRMCPGRDFAKVEILVFLHNLVRQFRWKLVFPDEKIGLDPLPVSAKGLPIYLYPHTHP